MNHPITLYETSVVIVAPNHDPSILNPDFLWGHRIVPEEIALVESEPSLSTPMLSQCAFENGLHIISEPNKISFADKNTGEGNVCYDTAKNYLRMVSLVHYIAVGINFVGSFPELEGKWAPHDMLRAGEWNQFEDVSLSANIALTYPLAGRVANMNIGRGAIAGPGSEQRTIIRGNFHHDIQVEQGGSYKAAIANVDNWENDLKDFKVISDNIARGIKQS